MTFKSFQTHGLNKPLFFMKYPEPGILLLQRKMAECLDLSYFKVLTVSV